MSLFYRFHPASSHRRSTPSHSLVGTRHWRGVRKPTVFREVSTSRREIKRQEARNIINGMPHFLAATVARPETHGTPVGAPAIAAAAGCKLQHNRPEHDRAVAFTVSQWIDFSGWISPPAVIGVHAGIPISDTLIGRCF